MYTRRIRVNETGDWKPLYGEFADASGALGAGYSAAVFEIQRGAHTVEFQILHDGDVVFQTPYAHQPLPLKVQRATGPIKAFTVKRTA